MYLLLLALIFPALAHAEGSFDLGEVVVTGRKPVVEQAGTVREVDRAEIEASQARSLDEAIDLLPGVNVRVGGNGTPRIDVRGLRTRHVKLLINGVPFNSAADGQFDPTLLPTDWISKIKLTSGASSQLYGDGGLGGVINLITRTGTGPLAGNAYLEGGVEGQERLGGSLSYGNEQMDVYVSVARRAQDGFALAEDFTPAPFEDGGRRLNSHLTRNTGFLSTTWRPQDAWEFGLSLQYSDGDHGLPSGIYDNTSDIYAQRPRYDKVTAVRSYSAQASARYEPGERWNHHSWAYVTAGQTELARYADQRFLPTTDPAVRNTFNDDTRTRTTGVHHQTQYTHAWAGTVAVMLEAREERLEGECLIRDVPLVVPAAVAPRQEAKQAAAAPADPTRLVLDYTVTLTNDAKVTGSGGGNTPIARLTATNRPGGGVDFSIVNLAGTRYGASSFLQSVFIRPRAGFDPTGLSFTQGLGSEADIGNVRFFSALENADGYEFPIQVNFKRPGQGNNFLEGETASWLFNKGSVTDFFGAGVPPTSGTRAPMFSAIRLRGADATGFWGNSPVDVTGGGLFPRVYVGAVATVDPDAVPPPVDPGTPTPPPPPPTPQPPPLDGDPEISGQLVQDRVCGGGAGGGDGSGGDGDGTGGNRVERLPGYVFGFRTLKQDKAIDVLSTALEWSFNPLPKVGLVAGVGHHWLRDDGESTSGDLGYNFGATWQVRDGLRLRANHARKIRPPSIAQLYDPVSGNERLGFERAELFEVGARQALGLKSSAELTLFKNDVAGLIQRNAVSGLFENVAETRFKGIELSSTTAVLPRTRLTVGYTYLHSRDESPGTQRKQQQYTPTHSASLSGDYQFTDSLSLRTSVQRVSDQYFYSRVTPLQRRELGAYTLVDSALRLSLPGRWASLYVGANNLLDADYAESYGLPQAGRMVYAGIELKLR